MPECATLRLQRSLASLALDAEPPAADAFGGFGEDLLVYRELVRMGLVDPVETTFPITMALLEEDGAWSACIDAFLDSRCVRSRHHRDIAPAFLGWLADTGWGRDRWPFILELAHFEILETLVYRFEDLPAPPDLAPVPRLTSRVVLDAATQVVAYGHAVHKSTEEAPRPAPGPAHLLAHRDPEGRFQVMELTPATAALLRDPRPLGEALAAMGVQDPATTFSLLASLRKAGAIAGFRDTLG